jgi:hypothetical protein
MAENEDENEEKWITHENTHVSGRRKHCLRATANPFLLISLAHGMREQYVVILWGHRDR